MTIHLENDLVRTHYDPTQRVYSYTIKRDGHRWTLRIPHADLEKVGLSATRRAHLARLLTAVMQGDPDAA